MEWEIERLSVEWSRDLKEPIARVQPVLIHFATDPSQQHRLPPTQFTLYCSAEQLWTISKAATEMLCVYPQAKEGEGEKGVAKKIKQTRGKGWREGTLGQLCIVLVFTI